MVENTMTLSARTLASSGSDAAVELSGLSMKYGDRTVVDDIDFTIAWGEVVTSSGPTVPESQRR